MYKYVIFDLDGTITDPKEGIFNSIMYTLNKFNVQLSDSSILYKFIGPPLLDSFENLLHFSKDDAILAVKYYREYYKEKGVNENNVYDNMEVLLKTLNERNYILLVATSKPEVFAKQILDGFNLSKYFKYIAGATLDGKISKKEDVISYLLNTLNITSPKDAIMVGDTKYDVLGANKNNLDCIGVLYGYGEKQEFLDAKATYIVKEVLDILNILK